MRLFITSFLTFLIISTSSFAGFAEGKKAYEKKDWMNAIKELRPLAEYGNADANMLIANMYSDGLGVLQNSQTAFNLYKRSAELGNVDAMLSVGTLYLNGVGTYTSYADGVSWYKKCANKRHYMCTFLMGMMELYGDNNSKAILKVEKDIKTEQIKTEQIIKAYKWFRISADNSANTRIAHTSGKLADLIKSEKLTPEELEKAESLVTEFNELYPLKQK